jgi:hypothetical protein
VNSSLAPSLACDVFQQSSTIRVQLDSSSVITKHAALQLLFLSHVAAFKLSKVRPMGTQVVKNDFASFDPSARRHLRANEVLFYGAPQVTGMSRLDTKDLLMLMTLALTDCKHGAATDWLRLVHNAGPFGLRHQLYSCFLWLAVNAGCSQEPGSCSPRYGRSNHTTRISHPSSVTMLATVATTFTPATHTSQKLISQNT